jgi:hypothetical protein
MRREPEFFGEQELVLVYMATKLKHALSLEAVLDEAAIDYAVVPDHFTSGILFRSTRVGAFFYVPAGFAELTRALIRRRGFKPYC